MFQQYLLKKAFSKLEKGPLNIVSSQCVRLRHKRAKCDKCIKACLKNAIRVDQHISVNEDLCNTCGDCYEICPAGVFSISALSDKKELSRREFFSYAKDKIVNAPKEIFNDILNDGKRDIKLPKIIPKKRISFLQKIKNHSKANKANIEDLSSKYLPFTNLSINDKCDSCDICTMFCPTGALSKKETKKNTKITFNIAYCTKCDLCINACPKSAITYSDNVKINPIIGKREKLLIKHELSGCEKCGTKFISDSSCPRCEKDKADDSFFG